MCDIGKAISRMFTPPGTGALEAQLEGQQMAANTASDAATRALTDAIAATQKASIPPIDDPSARAAGLDRMRAVMGMQGAASSFMGTPTAAPTVGTKVLLGQ